MVKRFQRPEGAYESTMRKNSDKYQQDSKFAISSTKLDADFNYIIDVLNQLKSVISGLIFRNVEDYSVGDKELVDNTVTESKFASEVVSNSNIIDGVVGQSKISDFAVTTSKIASSTLSDGDFATLSVGTEELQDGAVTKSKIAKSAQLDSMPVGAILKFMDRPFPTGWLPCNGLIVSQATYPDLFDFLTQNGTYPEKAIIPELVSDDETEYGIKAFSYKSDIDDKLQELADVDAFKLDVSDNLASSKDKAHHFIESIAEFDLLAGCSLNYSRGIKFITRLNTGRYKIYLTDEADLKRNGRNLKAFITARSQSTFGEFMGDGTGVDENGCYYRINHGDIYNYRDYAFYMCLYYEQAEAV